MFYRIIRLLFGLIVLGIFTGGAILYLVSVQYPEAMSLPIIDDSVLQKSNPSADDRLSHIIRDAAEDSTVASLTTSTSSATVSPTSSQSVTASSQSAGMQNLLFSFPRGSTLQDLLNKIGLSQPNFTAFDRLMLQVGMRLNGDGQRLKAGQYRMLDDEGNALTIRAMIDAIVAGDTAQFAITIPEGWTFAQMRRAIEGQANLTQTMAALSDEALLAEITQAYDHPEGLFLANTYFYDANTPDLTIYKQAHAALLQTLNSAWEDRAEGLQIKSAYEALIMASMIEKETGVSAERGQISGVFDRRLARGMRLQTDPTVIYGLGDDYRGTLYRSDLQQSTAYNTYVIDGLPPTPIALVGSQSIQAAVNPEPGSSLYFVADGQGGHYFSDTLEEHNQNVRKYRQSQE